MAAGCRRQTEKQKEVKESQLAAAFKADGGRSWTPVELAMHYTGPLILNASPLLDMKRQFTPMLILALAALIATPVLAQRKSKRAPSDLVRKPLVPADPTTFPGETEHLGVFLLIGQSNMKGT